jgi:erythromycin esterase
LGITIFKALQKSTSSFLEWADEHAITLTSIEPGQGFSDLQPLKQIIGDARVVALGEGRHGIHEFLAFRNRLFEFLVEEMEFTAIAVESGYSESITVDDYVLGTSDDSTEAALNVFSFAGPNAFVENEQLIDWMREYNTRPSSKRKIRFYGIDLSGGHSGGWINSRRALDAALVYIDRVDTDLIKQVRQSIEPFLEYFNDRDYHRLTPDERNTLTASINDLIDIFERQRVVLIAGTSALDYHRAYRHAVAARQLDGGFRVEPLPDADPSEWLPGIMARDAAMADNVRWVVDQEGTDGRVLLFAHNGHVRKYRNIMEADPIWGSATPPTMMGEYLHSMLKNEMVVFGFTHSHRPYTRVPADSTSIGSVLATLELPLFVLSFDSIPQSGPVFQWINQNRKIFDGRNYREMNLIKSFDALIFVDRTKRVSIKKVIR